MIENLNTKNIKEFVAGDTIYIKANTSKGHDQTFLCSFISYNKGAVTGKAISTEVNPELWENKIKDGFSLTARLDRCALYGKSIDISNAYYHWFNSQGWAMHPEETYKVDEAGELHIQTHPSFGLISVGRSNHSQDITLFGSSVKSSNTITLKIMQGEHKRDLNHDWFHSHDTLIEIEMSQSQFAELITSMNYGSGVPCTLRQVGKENMPDVPFISKVEQFNVEFKNILHNLGVDLSKMVNSSIDILTNKPSVNQGDHKFILNQIEALVREVQKNLPYVNEQFGKQMDKTITEAKGEIEAFFNHAIQSAGLKALQGNINMPQIEDGKEIDKNE